MQKTLSLAIAGLLFVACGTYYPPDVDNEQPKALRIAPGVLIKDSIAADGGDKIDWKNFSYFQDVRVTVTIAFGEMYKPHGVRGEITLFSFDGNVLQRQPIVPERRDYVFPFQAAKDKDYFFKIEAKSGGSGYMVETKVEPLDPCAACAPGTTCCRPSNLCCEAGTVCKEGACVKSDLCIPECGYGEFCVAGRCEEACPGGCPKGRRCSVELRRCVGEKVKDPGPAPVKKGCEVECKADEKCNEKTGQCETMPYFSGTVLQVTDEGGKAVILINRGSQDGIKPGASGTLGGKFPFRLSSVMATRSRAKLDVSPDQVKGLSKVIIQK